MHNDKVNIATVKRKSVHEHFFDDDGLVYDRCVDEEAGSCYLLKVEQDEYVHVYAFDIFSDLQKSMWMAISSNRSVSLTVLVDDQTPFGSRHLLKTELLHTFRKMSVDFDVYRKLVIEYVSE